MTNIIIIHCGSFVISWPPWRILKLIYSWKANVSLFLIKHYAMKISDIRQGTRGHSVHIYIYIYICVLEGEGRCAGWLGVTENTRWLSFIINKILYNGTVSLVEVTSVSQEPAVSICSDEKTSAKKVVTLCSQGDNGNHCNPKDHSHHHEYLKSHKLFVCVVPAPYVKLDMNPFLPGVDEGAVYKDAMFFSVHKFIGGVQTPGLYFICCSCLVFNRPCHSLGSQLPASHHGVPSSNSDQGMWDLWWTNQHRGRFSPSTTVSPASHPTDCSTLIVVLHLGLVQKAKQWPTCQVDSVSPHLKKPKLKES
jgi:hypothetical protein